MTSHAFYSIVDIHAHVHKIWFSVYISVQLQNFAYVKRKIMTFVSAAFSRCTDRPNVFFPPGLRSVLTVKKMSNVIGPTR